MRYPCPPIRWTAKRAPRAAPLLAHSRPPRPLGLLGDDVGRSVRLVPLGRRGRDNSGGLVYDAGHGTPPPNSGGVAASGSRFLRADLKNSKIALVSLRLLDAQIATSAEDSRVQSYRKRLFRR